MGIVVAAGVAAAGGAAVAGAGEGLGAEGRRSGSLAEEGRARGSHSGRGTWLCVAGAGGAMASIVEYRIQSSIGWFGVGLLVSKHVQAALSHVRHSHDPLIQPRLLVTCVNALVV